VLHLAAKTRRPSVNSCAGTAPWYSVSADGPCPTNRTPRDAFSGHIPRSRPQSRVDLPRELVGNLAFRSCLSHGHGRSKPRPPGTEARESKWKPCPETPVEGEDVDELAGCSTRSWRRLPEKYRVQSSSASWRERAARRSPRQHLRPETQTCNGSRWSTRRRGRGRVDSSGSHCTVSGSTS